MNVEIPPDLDEFVRRLIADGVVVDESEALVEGLRLLRRREQLRQDVTVGFHQLDRGEGRDGEVIFRELEQRIAEIERRTDIE